jgi:formylglycine-generating enzyme required for sulfatase activity
MEQNTVFISYRRALSKHLARSIYMDLKINGWDAFLDVNTIDSGDFDRIILNQIGARAHFILLISPGSLERCANSGDWVLREIQEAVRLERNIVPIIEEGADFSREIGYLPPDIRAIVSKKNSVRLIHDYFDEGVERLRIRFLKTPEYITITAPPAAERAEVQRRMAAVESDALASSSPLPAAQRRSGDGVRAILPLPFEWVEIPGGRGTMETYESNVILDIPTESYSIAKYPVTNAQYAKFIEAGGYKTQRWWTIHGWEHRQQDKWTQPRYWNDSKWNGAEQPVVGVSWYESVAFCLWLSDITSENIMLPTEAQWQYAAQGDDGRTFPWGNEWEGARCNNDVDQKGIGKTTPVRQYEGKGGSPFGVVDMAGNVWEWCLTDYANKTNDLNASAEKRVLRSGSWNSNGTYLFRCDFRNRYFPHSSNFAWGFRLSLS